MADEGEPPYAEVYASTYTNGIQYWAEIAAFPTGGFIVVWYSNVDGSGLEGVLAQRFDNNGNKLYR